MDRFGKRMTGCLLAAAAPLLAAGCGMMDPEPIRFMAELTASYNGVADGLATVKDPESARAATPQIDNQFARLCRLMDRMPELARKHANTKVRKTRLAQVTQGRNPEVRAAAKLAIQQVRQRTASAPAGQEESEEK